MKALIFFTALALFVITTSFLEYMVPTILGVDGANPELLGDSEYMLDFMRRQPPAMFVGIALAHFLAAVVAGLVLALGNLPKYTVWIMAAVCTLAGLANLLLLDGHPIWFWVLDLCVYLPGVYLGYTWVLRTRLMVQEKASRR